MSDQRDNSGVIFANDRKTKDSDPDGKGTATIGGVEYWISSWVNKGKNGVMYRKLSFSKKSNRSDSGATLAKTDPDVGGHHKNATASTAQPENEHYGTSEIPF